MSEEPSVVVTKFPIFILQSMINRIDRCAKQIEEAHFAAYKQSQREKSEQLAATSQ